MTSTKRLSKANIHTVIGFRKIKIASSKGAFRKTLPCNVAVVGDAQGVQKITRQEAANCLRYARK